MGPSEAEAYGAGLEHAKKTGGKSRFIVEVDTPNNGLVAEDTTVAPIKDETGMTRCYVASGFSITETIRAQSTSRKVASYQDAATADITKKLRDGLEKGLLQFTFASKPHDEDTAKAAAAYKQIGETLEHAVTFINPLC